MDTDAETPVTPLQPKTKSWYRKFHRLGSKLVWPTLGEQLRMTTVESIDYHDPDNLTKRSYFERIRRKDFAAGTAFEYFGVTVTAIIVGLWLGGIRFITESLRGYKTHLTHVFMDSEDENGPIYAFLFYIGSMLLLTFIGTMFSLWGKTATQSGFPGVVAYLNGVNIPELFTWQSLVVKSFGVIFSASSGLYLGFEGPLVGATIADFGVQLFSRARKWINKRHFNIKVAFQQSEAALRRDFTAIGTGVGLTAVFGAPLTGLCFIIEEISSFFSLNLVWKSFFACLLTYGTMTLTQLSKPPTAGISQRSVNPLCGYGSNGFQFGIADFFSYLIISIFGGCTGALFNKCIVLILRFRQGKPFTPRYRILETLALAAIIGFGQVGLPAFFECRPLTSQIFLAHPSMCFSLQYQKQMFSSIEYVGSKISPDIFHDQETCLQFSRNTTLTDIRNMEYDETVPSHSLFVALPIPYAGAYNMSLPLTMPDLLRHNCPVGYYSPMASLTMGTHASIIRLLYLRGTSDLIPFNVLLVFSLFIFIFAVTCIIAFLPGGTFIPQIAMGAVYGRTVAMILSWWEANRCSSTQSWLWLPDIFSYGDKENWQPTCLKYCQYVPDPSMSAIVGAASVLGGSIRLPLFLTIMMIEATDNYALLGIVAMAVIVSTWVGNRFNAGLFHSMMTLKGYPYLNYSSDYKLEKSVVSRAMGSPPVCVPCHATKGEIKTLLHGCKFNFFPVIFNATPKYLKNGALADYDERLLGTITREQLLFITTQNGSLDSDAVDLFPYMDRSPIIFQPNFHLGRAFDIFRRMGLRHAVVVDASTISEKPQEDPLSRSSSGRYSFSSNHSKLRQELSSSQSLACGITMSKCYRPVGVLTRKDLLPWNIKLAKIYHEPESALLASSRPSPESNNQQH